MEQSLTPHNTGLRVLSQETEDALVHAVEQGVPIATAAEALGFSKRTFHNWLRSAETGVWSNGYPLSDEAKQRVVRLSRRIARARAVFEQRGIKLIAEAAEKADKYGRLDWRAAAWILEHHPAYRERWYTYHPVDVEVRGEVSLEHRLVQNMSEEELRQILGELPQLS